MDLVGRLAYMLALLAVGVAARRAGVLGRTRTDRLNAVAFYVALPALIFHSTYGRSPAELVSARLVVALVAVIVATLGVGWFVHRRIRSRSTRSVALVQSYHGNFGYLGLPLVAATLGSAAAATGSVILGVGALTQVPLTILVLVSLNDASADLRGELRNVVTNPVLLALATALVASTLSVSVPDPALSGLGVVSELALPLALLVVGASIELEVPENDLDTLGAVVCLKVVLMPVLGWVAFTMLGVDGLTRAAGVVMFGAPTAVSTFVYANELGGDAEFASIGVFVTTVVSVLTLGTVVGLVV